MDAYASFGAWAVWAACALVGSSCVVSSGGEGPSEGDRGAKGAATREEPTEEERSRSETGAGTNAGDASREGETSGGPDESGADDCPLDDEERDRYEQPTGHLACDRLSVGRTVELDFDGDGRDDTVRYAKRKGRYYLDIQFAEGRREQLGLKDGADVTRAFYRESQRLQYDDDFSWVVDWTVSEREGGSIGAEPGWKVEDSRGDGLQLSATSLQTVLYLSTDGWILMGLGF